MVLITFAGMARQVPFVGVKRSVVKSKQVRRRETGVNASTSATRGRPLAGGYLQIDVALVCNLVYFCSFAFYSYYQLFCSCFCVCRDLCAVLVIVRLNLADATREHVEASGDFVGGASSWKLTLPAALLPKPSNVPETEARPTQRKEETKRAPDGSIQRQDEAQDAALQGVPRVLKAQPSDPVSVLDNQRLVPVGIRQAAPCPIPLRRAALAMPAADSKTLQPSQAVETVTGTSLPYLQEVPKGSDLYLDLLGELSRGCIHKPQPEVMRMWKVSKQKALGPSGISCVLRLWHGTRSSTSACGILEEGFSLAKAKCGSFGRGLYFTPHACKGLNYTDPDRSQGAQLLFLCEVAVGDRDHRMLCPRPRSSMTQGLCCTELQSMGFESIEYLAEAAVDVQQSVYLHDEFVVYQASQARPIYLLEVKPDGQKVCKPNGLSRSIFRHRAERILSHHKAPLRSLSARFAAEDKPIILSWASHQ